MVLPWCQALFLNPGKFFGVEFIFKITHAIRPGNILRQVVVGGLLGCVFRHRSKITHLTSASIFNGASD